MAIITTPTTTDPDLTPTAVVNIGDELHFRGEFSIITGTVLDLDDESLTAKIDVWGAGAHIGLYLPDWTVTKIGHNPHVGVRP